MVERKKKKKFAKKLARKKRKLARKRKKLLKKATKFSQAYHLKCYSCEMDTYSVDEVNECDICGEDLYLQVFQVIAAKHALEAFEKIPREEAVIEIKRSLSE